jgi:hypothetical protein
MLPPRDLVLKTELSRCDDPPLPSTTPMKEVILPIVRFYCVLLCVWLAGCGQKPVLTEVLSEKMEVVEAPYPLGYPSTSPQKNRIIATLHRGERFYLRGEDFGKEYKYFEVELLDRKKGFVIYEGGGRPEFRRIDDK